MSLKVKICGITRTEDARAAAAAGADALGLNFVAKSPRFLRSMEQARALLDSAQPFSGLAVGLFVNATASEILATARDVKLDVIQLHGEEPPELADELRRNLNAPLWKAYRIATQDDLDAVIRQDWPCDALLLDARVEGAHGGTGRTFDWDLLTGFPRKKPLVLAGGLKPANVAEAVERAHPDWVDTSSGVESAPGIKDAAMMQRFVDTAKKQ